MSNLLPVLRCRVLARVSGAFGRLRLLLLAATAKREGKRKHSQDDAGNRWGASHGVTFFKKRSRAAATWMRTFAGAVPPRLARLAAEASTVSTLNTS